MSRNLLVVGRTRPISFGGGRHDRFSFGAGGSATVVALSYGERGESGELWKEPGQTVENVKRTRHEEAVAAAAALARRFAVWTWGTIPSLSVTWPWASWLRFCRSCSHTSF